MIFDSKFMKFNFNIWVLLNYSSISQLTLVIDINTKMILYMGKITRSHLRLSPLGNATYSWISAHIRQTY